jgi:pyridoxamine 5'-phosphate oxidase|tara:strand:- start:1559 stop:2212 length:654 start_codon:yes stop_codon:yes gene_type:complete
MSTEPSTESASTLEQGDEGGIPQGAEQLDPIEFFKAWFDAAEDSGIVMPESVALATATSEGAPSVRMVLLKAVNEKGFVFFTNYGSRKANEIEANRRAALCFHWASLERQVRITGSVERITEAESYAYFSTRGRGSRIGAWASKQSQPLLDRKELQRRVSETTSSFADQDIPLPPFWGGYRIRPEVIEFWQGKADRLHDRLVFTRIGRDWSTERLYP